MEQEQFEVWNFPPSLMASKPKLVSGDQACVYMQMRWFKTLHWIQRWRCVEASNQIWISSSLRVGWMVFFGLVLWRDEQPSVTYTSKMRFSAPPSWMQYSLCAIWLLKSQNYSFSSPDLFQKLLLNKWWMYLLKCLQQQIYLFVLRIVCASSRQNKNSSFILVDEDVKCRKADTLNHCVSNLNSLYLNFLAVCFFSIFNSLA